MGGMHDFWICFVPLFAALNPISIVPTFIALTEDLSPARLRRTIVQSLVTATAAALAFLAVGRAVFNLLGVTVADFMVAGGILLFVISLRGLLGGDSHRSVRDDESMGAVPIGVPLIVGPATLTTGILLLGQHGILPTVSALLANLAIVAVTLRHAGRIHRTVGRAGSKALSKLAELLLAAIGVMIVRKGLIQIVTGTAR